MKAAFYNKFGELDNIETGELDKPEPGEGEVLVRIKAAGVNPVDAFATQGMLKDAIPSEFPTIPGWDVAGVVEKEAVQLEDLMKAMKCMLMHADLLSNTELSQSISLFRKVI